MKTAKRVWSCAKTWLCSILKVVVRLLAIFGPVIAAALVVNARLPLAASLGCYAAGLFLWTLLEYGIHRFAFHGFLPHYQHHDDPKDPKYIVSPLWLSCGTSALLWMILRIPAGSWARSAMMLAGIVCGYLAYEAVHLKIHANEAGGPLLRELRKRHYIHHFADDHIHYGVTTSIWDRVFGSTP
jgi:sterol desaturase/sphingolipid hydroxylase (fatty acid hydroxylase superfamily)